MRYLMIYTLLFANNKRGEIEDSKRDLLALELRKSRYFINLGLHPKTELTFGTQPYLCIMDMAITMKKY